MYASVRLQSSVGESNSSAHADVRVGGSWLQTERVAEIELHFGPFVRRARHRIDAYGRSDRPRCGAIRTDTPAVAVIQSSVEHASATPANTSGRTTDSSRALASSAPAAARASGGSARSRRVPTGARHPDAQDCGAHRSEARRSSEQRSVTPLAVHGPAHRRCQGALTPTRRWPTCRARRAQRDRCRTAPQPRRPA
jgi:hypothetical protein